VRIEINMTTLLIIAILALVAVQTLQLLSLSSVVSSLQVGGGAVAPATSQAAKSAASTGVGAC